MVRLERLHGRHAAQVGVGGCADVGVAVVQVSVRVVPHHVLLAPHERRRTDLHTDFRQSQLGSCHMCATCLALHTIRAGYGFAFFYTAMLCILKKRCKVPACGAPGLG